MKRNGITKDGNGDRRNGFTVVELLVASALTLLIVGGAFGVFIQSMRFWRGINCRMEADREANLALSRLVYGVGDRQGLRAAATVAVQRNGGDWTTTYWTASDPPQTNSFTYTADASNLVFNPGGITVAREVSFASVVQDAHVLVVTVRVDRVEGALHARRELETKVYWRNN